MSKHDLDDYNSCRTEFEECTHDCWNSLTGVGGGGDEQSDELPEVSIGAAGDAASDEGDSSSPSLLGGDAGTQ